MIVIKENRKVYPDNIKIANKYENKTGTIDFDLSYLNYIGNKYLVCKYVSDDDYKKPLLLDQEDKISIQTFLTAQAGIYQCVLVVSSATIDDNYNFKNDDPLFISNVFQITVEENFLAGTSTAWDLTPAMKNKFDELLALIKKVNSDLESGTFIGPPGPVGPQGETGPVGPQGETGETGATGATGATPNLTIGNVETLEPDEPVKVTLTGTKEEPVLNLALPKGKNGTSKWEELEGKPNLYTQEEVNYLLGDKMDKPYISVTIGEDAVLNDCLDGNLKVDSIEGYSLQDNTSPSPTIPSEVKGVDKINIRTVGKNLFDSEKIFKLGYQKYYRTFLEYENGVFQVDNQNEGEGYVKLSRLSELNIKAPFVFSVELNSDDCQAIIIAIGETGAWVKQFHCTKATNSVSIKQDPNVDDYMIIFKTSVAGHKFEVSNIQIEQGESATDYEPYIETRLDYTLDKPLLALPNGVKDTIENGIATRRVGEITFDGSEAWNRNNVNDPNNWLYYLSMSHGKADGLCNSLMHEPFNIVNKGADLASVGFNLAHNEKNIFINVGYYMEQAGLTNTVADLKTWLQSNPITVWYELATPTTEPITEELLNALKKLKTFAPVTNVFIGGEVKPTIVVKYPQDILTVVNRLESRLLTLQEEAIKNV